MSMTDNIHPRIVTLIPAASIKDDVPVWAWEYGEKGRIQLGTLALFAGRPTAGKSTAARWFAGGYSQGTIDGCWLAKPENVAYVAAEESGKYVVKPGLRAAGADMNRIYFPTITCADEHMQLLGLNDEAELTTQFLAMGVTVVVVDPMMSTIGGHVDVHRNNEVRSHIQPWARIAENINGVVIGVV